MVSFQQTSANKKTYVADAIVLLTEKKKKLLSFCKLLTKYSFETRFGLVWTRNPALHIYIYKTSELEKLKRESTFTFIAWRRLTILEGYIDSRGKKERS